MMALLLLQATGASRGDTSWTPSLRLVKGIERHITLPKNASALTSYDRYYWGEYDGGRKILVGQFLSMRSDKTRRVGKIYISTRKDKLEIRDGGCGVIDFAADAQSG